MTAVDIRIIFVIQIFLILLCSIVMAFLWWQNRKRFPAIGLWLTDYVLQFAAIIFITLRGVLPDLISIILAHISIVAGTIILYIGLGRYVGRESRQWHNYVMLIVFTLVHVYFTYVYPDIELRTVNSSLALIYICSQCAWLMLRQAAPNLRTASRMAGIVFLLFCLVGVVQIVVNLSMPRTNDLFVTGFVNLFAIITFQILFVALTFSLFLLVSRRLSLELERALLKREQEDKIMRLRLSLLEFATNHSLEEVLQKTLDEIGILVDSPIGFYHFVEEDQTTLSLQAWSTRTLNEFCKAEGRGRHYGIDQAGVWVDCVYQKRAVIHNDYSSLPHRKGLPEGHAPVIRELVVPILRGDKVMAILGIGNKPTYYTEKDAEVVSYLADVAWEISLRKQAEEALKKSKEKYKQLAEVFPESIFEANMKGAITYANPHGLKQFGLTNEDIAKGLNILDFVSPDDREVVIERIQNRINSDNKGYLEYNALKKDGSAFHALTLSVPIMAEGMVVGIRGFIMDITERKQAEEQIKHLATHDLLTDLPSLRLAKDRLTSALNMARRYKKSAAVMFIDLDGFKVVNDTLGHDAGDYMLKQVAQRMLSCVRETDTVARVGGDEFLIIATEIMSADNAAQIAQKVIQMISQPILINGEKAVVGASIGIALFPEHSEDVDRLIKLADEAMYKVKNSGKNNYRFAEKN